MTGARRRRRGCPRRSTLDPKWVEERAAIIAEGCGVSQSMALARARELVRRYCKPRDEVFHVEPVDNLPEELDLG